MALITGTIMSPGMSGRWSPKDEGNRLLQDVDNHLTDINSVKAKITIWILTAMKTSNIIEAGSRLLWKVGTYSQNYIMILKFELNWEFNDWMLHQVGLSNQTPLDTYNKLPNKTDSGDQMKQETGFVLSCLCGTRYSRVWMPFLHLQCILRPSELQHRLPHAGAGDDIHHLLLNSTATDAIWVYGALSGYDGSHLWHGGGGASFVAAAGMLGMMMPRFHSLVDPVGHRVGQNLQEQNTASPLWTNMLIVYEHRYLNVKQKVCKYIYEQRNQCMSEKSLDLYTSNCGNEKKISILY